jgi:hypothetical protein
MASADITSVRRRGIAAIAGAVVLAALAVAGSAPASAAARAASPDVPVSPFLLGPSAQSAADASARAQAASAEDDVTPIALGYLLDDGVFTRVAAPGPDLETVPYGINNRQQILGSYVDVGGTAMGSCFIRAASARSRSRMPPESTPPGSSTTPGPLPPRSTIAARSRAPTPGATAKPGAF